MDNSLYTDGRCRLFGMDERNWRKARPQRPDPIRCTACFKCILVPFLFRPEIAPIWNDYYTVPVGIYFANYYTILLCFQAGKLSDDTLSTLGIIRIGIKFVNLDVKSHIKLTYT